MKLLYRVLRFFVVIAICLAVVVPAVTYVALSVTPVQQRIARQCERSLSELLHCRVSIGGLGIVPFNRVVLRDVVVETAPGDTVLTARRLGAGVRLWSLVSDDPVTVNYVELTGMDARLEKASPGAPLNIQPIIDALKPKDQSKPPTAFDLRINTVLLRSSKVSYDVLSEPGGDTFNSNHVAVSHLRADIRLPRLRNNDFVANIKRMGFVERSGFRLENLSMEAHVADSLISVRNFALTLPKSNLLLNDVSLPLNGLGSIGRSLETEKVELAVAPGSYVSLSDFAPFVAGFDDVADKVDIRRLELSGNLAEVGFNVSLRGSRGLKADIAGMARDIRNRTSRVLSVRNLSVAATGEEIGRIAGCFKPLDKGVVRLLDDAGTVAVFGDGVMTGGSFDASLGISTAAGGLDILVRGAVDSKDDFSAWAEITTSDAVNIGLLAGNADLGEAEGVVTAEIASLKGRLSGSAEVNLDRIQLKGYTYSDFAAEATLENSMVRGRVTLDNPDAAFDLRGVWSFAHGHKLVELQGRVDRFVPSALNLWGKYPGASACALVDVAMAGARLDNMTGYITVSDFRFAPAVGQPLELHNLHLSADSALVTLRSDYLDGEVRGEYDFPHIAATARDILSQAYPSLTGGEMHRENQSGRVNDFTFRLTVKETEKLAEFFHLPLSVIYPVSIAGEVSDLTHDMALTLDAPFLRQGTKLIEDTRLSAFVNGADGSSGLDLTTKVPTKNGPMTLLTQNTGNRDYIHTGVSWKIDRACAYEGSVGAVTTFSREDAADLAGGVAAGADTDTRLVTRINLLPGNLTFNDSTWTVNPAKITVTSPGDISVEGINVHRSNQFVKIGGTVSADAASLLTLDLRNFSLDYLFESLGIDKVMLGGDASGTFYASRLLSSEPVLETPGLHVKGISYNKTVLGDAVVKSRWVAENKAITLDAEIDQEKGRRSFVDGAIFPLNDSLDITFNVDHANVGFMQPYMEAFASDITGHASGRARIFGNFKYIDLEGDVFADDLRLKVNFTNTYYTATDSVHFRPGLIDLNGITIYDVEGHAARLNGWVKHVFFKEPRFEFGLSGAHDFLSYNETPRENPVWHGKIYGNGSAFVKGEPGRIDISVDMATAPRSTFTFVLSDQEVADEYSFLTFRDKGKLSGELADTVLLHRDTSMDLVNRLKAMVDAHSDDEPSDYNISLQMRVTPDAQIVLVMDPGGGDRIRAYGSGHLRMDYGSANSDLKMYGTYTLDRGDYNFTLQDVIIKDFTIKPGSEIVFNGDPYGAQLKIQAVYSLNANLSDLDESFLQDKDLNRTNVPVHALMKVNGDIRQPEITFDLEFPTLTTDIYRKVRSIISTDDMMNRQIIYLLALNRFYTPEYMTSTTKGNELVSVASSTISSQLGNLLGQISDNWNIAPTFRSDRGDFSDVEVDVALSSRLLNNRLLFNGNFGYRDNSLNSNQFIGDFDLEYILDREGMWRLKAYNRYNDQNYYLRTAHTTQGVGVVLKRDFDSFFSFLRAFRKKKKE